MQEYVAEAKPVKRFFVDTLVRDITLEDSILDLLDNCIDGVMRTQGIKGSEKPYEGFKAHLTIESDRFSIIDNCGGISLELARNVAFRMGRSALDRDVGIPTIGVYGIGMKRAIFKMGKDIEVKSRTGEDFFKVVIDQGWLDKDDEWQIPIITFPYEQGETGLSIEVRDVYETISAQFVDEVNFLEPLKEKISKFFGHIIDKGFEVQLNGEKIKPSTANLLVESMGNEKGAIAPYIYQTSYDGVDVTVMVGFYRNLTSEQEDEEMLMGKPSRNSAGWTVICNDRVVLYADKSRVTGWGEAGVPHYHSQFVSIAGTVVFNSTNPSLLPLTTTKRGIDGNSELYLAVKDFMREGLSIFTNFTNKWKKSTSERREVSEKASSVKASTLVSQVPSNAWSEVKKSIGGKKFKPELPLPKSRDPEEFLRFRKKRSQINLVARDFFEDEVLSPSQVGSLCFDYIYEKVRS